MPDAIRVQVAIAVVTSLQAGVTAGSFASTFTPVRSNASKITKLADADTDLRVDVVCSNLDTVELASRKSTRFGVGVEVLIRKRCTRTDGVVPTSQTDPLDLLTEQLAEWFLREDKRLLSNQIAYSGSEIKLHPMPMHLAEWTQYTNWFRLEFVCDREHAA